MDPVQLVLDFLKRLVRARLSGVEIQAKSKLYNARVRAESKASSAINKRIDAGLDKAKAKVTGSGKDGPARPGS